MSTKLMQMRERVKEELKSIPKGIFYQNLLRTFYWSERMHSLGKKAKSELTGGDVLKKCIEHVRKEDPSFKAIYEKKFFKINWEKEIKEIMLSDTNKLWVPRGISEKLGVDVAEVEEVLENIKCETASECVNVQADVVRNKMLKYFADYGVKKSECGVGIQERKKLEYEINNALTWATQKGLALKLDVRAFEKIAKSTPLDFVTETVELKATIPAAPKEPAL